MLSGTLPLACPARLDAGSSHIDDDRLTFAHIRLSHRPDRPSQIPGPAAEQLDQLDNQPVTTPSPGHQETIVALRAAAGRSV